jgi:F0F1-type ATP synthase assembly protein I
MIGAILMGAWLGSLLDDYFVTSKAYFTAAFMLLGVGTSILLLIRKLSSKE